MDQDLINRYVARQLTEAEEDAFELELFDSEELQDAVNIAVAMRAGMQVAAAQARASNAPETPAAPAAAPLQAANESKWPASPIALAASFMLAISVGFHLVPDDGAGLTSIDDVIYVETVRGGEAEGAQEVRANFAFALAIELGPEPRSSYSVEIRQGETAVTQTDALVPSAHGYLHVVVPPLAAGGYEVLLDGNTSTRIVAR